MPFPLPDASEGRGLCRAAPPGRASCCRPLPRSENHPSVFPEPGVTPTLKLCAGHCRTSSAAGYRVGRKHPPHTSGPSTSVARRRPLGPASFLGGSPADILQGRTGTPSQACHRSWWVRPGHVPSPQGRWGDGAKLSVRKGALRADGRRSWAGSNTTVHPPASPRGKRRLGEVQRPPGASDLCAVGVGLTPGLVSPNPQGCAPRPPGSPADAGRSPHSRAG